MTQRQDSSVPILRCVCVCFPVPDTLVIPPFIDSVSFFLSLCFIIFFNFFQFLLKEALIIILIFFSFQRNILAIPFTQLTGAPLPNHPPSSPPQPQVHQVWPRGPCWQVGLPGPVLVDLFLLRHKISWE